MRAIAAVICISSLVTTLTGWQFLALMQQFLVKKDAIAAFYGEFNFYAGVLSLLFQLLLTTRFLRRFGIGTALFVLPVTVLLGSTGLVILGTLGAAVALKGCDQVLRYSLDKSTTELLYLPLSVRIKLQVKWFIDTVIWRLGDGLAGLTVLIFATTLHWPARQISWIALLLVAGWLAAVAVARRICRHPERKHRATSGGRGAHLHSVLDRSTAELMATNLSCLRSQGDPLCPQPVRSGAAKGCTPGNPELVIPLLCRRSGRRQSPFSPKRGTSRCGRRLKLAAGPGTQCAH